MVAEPVTQGFDDTRLKSMARIVECFTHNLVYRKRVITIDPNTLYTCREGFLGNGFRCGLLV